MPYLRAQSDMALISHGLATKASQSVVQAGGCAGLHVYLARVGHAAVSCFYGTGWRDKQQAHAYGMQQHIALRMFVIVQSSSSMGGAEGRGGVVGGGEGAE